MAPLGAEADLVVWWNEGYYAQEGEAVREIIAAFEERTGKQVELVLHPEQELPDKVVAAVEAGEPNSTSRSASSTSDTRARAYEGRPVDLTDAIGHFADLFDRDALDAVTCSTRQRAGGSTCCRWGLRPTCPRLEEPARARRLHARGHPKKEWRRSGPFACDQVQPAVREALGRDDGGRRPHHVGRLDRHGERVLAVRGRLRG